MVELLEHPRVSTTVGHQCCYGLASRGPHGELPAKKPTMSASSSVHMLARLSKKCDKSHRHQQLTEGRAAAAAFYPPQLIEQILRGIRDTADAEAQQKQDALDEDLDRSLLVQALHRAGAVHDVPAPLPLRIQEQDLEKKLAHLKISIKHADGTTEKISQMERILQG